MNRGSQHLCSYTTFLRIAQKLFKIFSVRYALSARAHLSGTLTQNVLASWALQRGGHLAARVSTGFDIKAYEQVDKLDAVSCKPDFTVLLYPAYMNKGEELTNDFKVSSELSPTLIITAKDDKLSYPGNQIYAKALKEAGASVRTHFFEKGGHGFSLRPKQYPLSRQVKKPPRRSYCLALILSG